MLVGHVGNPVRGLATAGDPMKRFVETTTIKQRDLELRFADLEKDLAVNRPLLFAQITCQHRLKQSTQSAHKDQFELHILLSENCTYLFAEKYCYYSAFARVSS